MRNWNNWLWIYGHIINDMTINTAKRWGFEAAVAVKPKKKWDGYFYFILISSWLCHKLCLEMLYSNFRRQTIREMSLVPSKVGKKLTQVGAHDKNSSSYTIGQFRRLNIVSSMGTRTLGQIWIQTKSGKWNVCRNHKLSYQWSFFFFSILHIMSRVSCQLGCMKTPRQPAK